MRWHTIPLQQRERIEAKNGLENYAYRCAAHHGVGRSAILRTMWNNIMLGGVGCFWMMMLLAHSMKNTANDEKVASKIEEADKETLLKSCEEVGTNPCGAEL